MIDSMKVAELKTYLAERNLSGNELKAFLVAILKESVANGTGSVEIFIQILFQT